jgi:hypothetical protein
VAWTEGFLRHYATLGLEDRVIQDDAAGQIVVRHRPLGVVVGIIAWNFPLLVALWKIGPATLAGNAIVLKPAPTTPVARSCWASLRAGVSGRRGQRDHRCQRPGAAPDRAPGCRQDRLHRIDRDGQAHCRERARIRSSASRWNWAATIRRSCWMTWTCARRQGDLRQCLPQLRAGLPGDQARLCSRRYL